MDFATMLALASRQCDCNGASGDIVIAGDAKKRPIYLLTAKGWAEVVKLAKSGAVTAESLRQTRTEARSSVEQICQRVALLMAGGQTSSDTGELLVNVLNVSVEEAEVTIALRQALADWSRADERDRNAQAVNFALENWKLVVGETTPPPVPPSTPKKSGQGRR